MNVLKLILWLCGSAEENERRFNIEEELIINEIQDVLSNGGKLYSLSFGREIGIVTVGNGQIDNLYIEGQYQANGFGSRLLEYAIHIAGKAAYMDVPVSNRVLLHICEKSGLHRTVEDGERIRMVKS